MANIRAIRARIKSVESTRKITRSMKMVAAAKLKRVQQAMNTLRPYSDALRAMLAASAAEAVDCSPLLEKREAHRVCYVLIVGNRGLCGVYNTALLKYMTECAAREERDFSVVVCGRWGRDMIAASGLPVVKTIDDIGDSPSEEDASGLVALLREMYVGGEADEIVLVYEQYASALRQVPCCRTLLPIEAGSTDAEDRIFEPDRKTVAARLAELYFQSTVYYALLEARTGEHSARMTAMTSASDNTEQLIADLKLKLNHARQAAITTEISEIVGGANALSSDNEREG